METPNINSSPLLRSLRDALWNRLRDNGNIKKRQVTAWIEKRENDSGSLWDEEIGPLLDRLEERVECESCYACGEPNDDGEGWAGYCGNCADKHEKTQENKS